WNKPSCTERFGTSCVVHYGDGILSSAVPAGFLSTFRILDRQVRCLALLMCDAALPPVSRECYAYGRKRALGVPYGCGSCKEEARRPQLCTLQLTCLLLRGRNL
ncbi:unnamed protein product, partial [Ectocarpus sp. 8 AP-2014]